MNQTPTNQPNLMQGFSPDKVIPSPTQDDPDLSKPEAPKIFKGARNQLRIAKLVPAKKKGFGGLAGMKMPSTPKAGGLRQGAK